MPTPPSPSDTSPPETDRPETDRPEHPGPEHPGPETAGPPRPGPRRRFRGGRLLRRLAVVAILLPILALIVVARTPVAGMLVLPRIERASGLEIDAVSVRLAFDGNVVLRGLRARLPGVPGPKGRVLVADRVEVAPDWAALRRGRASIREVVVVGPRVRVSQSMADGSVPLARLLEGSGAAADLGALLPRVRVREGALALAEHDRPGGGDDRVYAEVPVEGDLFPRSGADRRGRSVTRVVLRGRTPIGTGGGAGAPIQISGELRADTIELTSSGFLLENWPALATPPAVRGLLSELDMRGRVEPRRIAIESDGTFELDLGLSGVALSLPFTARGRELGPDQQPLGLNEVGGVIRVSSTAAAAQLSGRADRLVYSVRLDWWGLEIGAPFLARLETEPFRLERDMRLFRFLPGVVSERLADFGPPQGEVRGEVWLSRGDRPTGGRRVATAGQTRPPTLAVPVDSTAPPDALAVAGDAIEMNGELRIDRGGAAYRGFPYPLENVSGRLRFNERFVSIEELRGSGPRGADAVVSGWVGPVGDAAEVRISVLVNRLPVSERLTEAMGPGRASFVRSLLSRRDRAALIEEGYLAASGLDRPDLPAFELGGVLDVTVGVHRAYGTVSDWTRDVRVRAERLGLLPERFPLPLTARDLDMRITDEGARIEQLRLEPLGGGTGRADAFVPVGGARVEVTPDADVRLEGVPIGPMLVRAAVRAARRRDATGSEAERPAGETAGAAAAADDGPPVDLDGVDAPRPPVPGLAFGGEVDLRLRSGTEAGAGGGTLVTGSVRDGALRVGRRRDADPAAAVREIGAGFEIRDDRLEASGGLRFVADEPLGPVGFELRTGPIGSDRAEGDAGAGGTRLEASLTDLDLASPLAPVLEAVSPLVPGAGDAASRVRDARAEADPRGRVDVSFEGEWPAGAGGPPGRLRLSASRLRDVSVAALGGRLETTSTAGSVVYDTGASRLSFRDLRARVVFDDEPAGTVALSGGATVSTQRGAAPVFAPEPALRVDLTGGRLGSPLLRRLAVMGEPRLGQPLRRIDPRGRLDARLTLEPDDAGGVSVSGELRPTELTLEALSGTLRARTVGGVIELGDTGGRIRGVRLSGLDGEAPTPGGDAPGQRLRGRQPWRLGVDGSWTAGERGVRAEATLSVEAGGLPDSLLALLPGGVARALDEIGLVVDKRLRGRGLRLEIETPNDLDAPDGGGRTGVVFEGELEVEGAGLDLGLEVSALDGTLDIRASRPAAADAGAEFEVEVAAPRARVVGVAVSDVATRLRSTPGGGPGVVVPELTANAHGGRLSASGLIGRSAAADTADGAVTSAGGAALRYRAELSLSNVRLAPLLEDLAAGPAGGPGRGTGGGDDRGQPDDNSRGQLGGRFALTGVVGDDASRWGSGRFYASGGPVLELPLLTPLIEFTNLRVPTGDRLSDAVASMRLLGNEVAFERLSVRSQAVEIYGFGAMTLPGAELDLRLRSRSRDRIPILSDVLESVRDEIVSTRIVGTLQDPRVTTEPFPATARVVSALLGGRDSDAAARLRELGRQARTLGDRAAPEATPPVRGTVSQPSEQGRGPRAGRDARAGSGQGP